MVPASSHKVSRVSWYSGSCRPALPFAYGAFTLFGWPSQDHSAGPGSCLCSPKPRGARATVWAPPISLAATLGIDFSFFSSGYLDVSVRRVPFHTLWIHAWIPEVSSGGFPHSDICGSLLICSSPQLFAACHVFHRLPVPRHPPCALLCLTLPFSRLAWRYLGVSRISPGFCLVCMSPCFPALWHACTCLAFGTLLHVSVLHVPLGCLVYLVFDLIFKIFFQYSVFKVHPGPFRSPSLAGCLSAIRK